MDRYAPPTAAGSAGSGHTARDREMDPAGVEFQRLEIVLAITLAIRALAAADIVPTDHQDLRVRPAFEDQLRSLYECPESRAVGFGLRAT